MLRRAYVDDLIPDRVSLAFKAQSAVSTFRKRPDVAQQPQQEKKHHVRSGLDLCVKASL